MKKKELKKQIVELQTYIGNLINQRDSNSWKLKLFKDLEDPDLLLIDYITDIEPPIDITTHMDVKPQYLKSGRMKVTMNLISKSKKEE